MTTYGPGVRPAAADMFERGLGRDFASDGPWRKMGTDATEFRCSFGKACLAPACDFGSREVAAWSISESPDTAQQEEMLDMPISRMPEGARPAPRSDMGRQHQGDRYVSRLRAAGIVQSMSRKDNCLDNACAEGLFGHMKDEFFRGRDWDDSESFKKDLEACIVHWDTRRGQKGLKGLTPEEFRSQSLMAV